MSNSKICSKCQNSKCISEYYICSGIPQSRCKECVLALKLLERQQERAKRTPSLPPTKKECTKCHLQKDLELFTKSSAVKSGRFSVCKVCKNIDQQEFREQQRLAKPPRPPPKDLKRSEDTKVKRKTDLNFRLSEILRSKVHRMIRGLNTRTYQKLIGLDPETLKKWLEFQFTPEMNWDNLGTYWEIDHILAITQFNYTHDVDTRVCFRWQNLQPLEKMTNILKSNKFELHYYYNSIISIHRFIQNEKLDISEYQGINESLSWLREKLKG